MKKDLIFTPIMVAIGVLLFLLKAFKFTTQKPEKFKTENCCFSTTFSGLFHRNFLVPFLCLLHINFCSLIYIADSYISLFPTTKNIYTLLLYAPIIYHPLYYTKHFH